MAFPSERTPPMNESPPAQPATGVRSVRLNRDREITPTLLDVYRTCPRKFRLQYIDRVRTPWQYEHNLSQGRVAHLLLADAARRLRAGAPPLGLDDLRTRAVREIPRDPFPTPEAHDDAVHEVVQWVGTGIRALMRDPDGEILLVETDQKRPFAPDDSLWVSFRCDLVRWSADADGEFVEVIDYKTGKPRVDPAVPVIARFVLNRYLERHYGRNGWHIRARFTYVWLKERERTEIALDPEACADPWRLVSGLVARLFSEEEWRPTPSPLCKWCRFYRIACDAGETTSPGLLFEGPGE